MSKSSRKRLREKTLAIKMSAYNWAQNQGSDTAKGYNKPGSTKR